MGNKIQPPRAWRYDETWREIVENSGHFFDVDSMRWFRSRISWGSLIKTQRGYAFISSEKYENAMTGDSAPRTYTIREWNTDSGIETVGAFQEYATARDARVALHTLIARKVL